MTLPNWAQLEKAQDDNQTINEAIAAAITAHNADSEAHLDEGGSLESHKTEGMIDHPAGSIATDKLPQEHVLITAFESIDGWLTFDTGSGQVFQDFGSVRLYTGSTSSSWVYLYAIPSVWVPFDLSKNTFWKATIRLTSTSDQLAYFSWGGPNTGDFISGLGFKVVDGTLYAYQNDDESESLSSSISVTLTDWHAYEIRYDASSGLAEWVIDGTVVYSDTLSFSAPQSDEIASFLIRNDAGAAKQLQVTDLVFQSER